MGKKIPWKKRKRKEDIDRIIKDVNECLKKGQTIKQIAEAINMSRQTTSKWIKQIKNGTFKAKTHIPINKISDENNQLILSETRSFLGEIRDRFDNNYTPGLAEFYSRLNPKVSKEHFRKLSIENNIVFRRTQKKTIKKMKAKLRALKKSENVSNEITQLEQDIEKMTVYKGKTGAPGFRVEIDGCFDTWINGEKYCLLLGVDSFTGMILAMHMEKEETNLGYFNLLSKLFARWGKPAEIRSDRRNGLAQGMIHEAITKLGIEMNSEKSPTFKANVERANQSAISFLPMELMKKEINSIDEFNKNSEIFTNAINKKFKKEIPEDNCFMQFDIDEFRIFKTRKVLNEVSHVSIDNKMWAPFRNGKRCIFSGIQKIYIDLENRYYIFDRNEKIFLKEIKDILLPPSITNEYKKLERLKKKTKRFFETTYNKKINEVNSKIKELRKENIDIDFLETTL